MLTKLLFLIALLLATFAQTQAANHHDNHFHLITKSVEKKVAIANQKHSLRINTPLSAETLAILNEIDAESVEVDNTGKPNEGLFYQMVMFNEQGCNSIFAIYHLIPGVCHSEYDDAAQQMKYYKYVGERGTTDVFMKKTYSDSACMFEVSSEIFQPTNGCAGDALSRLVYKIPKSYVKRPGFWINNFANANTCARNLLPEAHLSLYYVYNKCFQDEVDGDQEFTAFNQKTGVVTQVVYTSKDGSCSGSSQTNMLPFAEFACKGDEGSYVNIRAKQHLRDMTSV